MTLLPVLFLGTALLVVSATPAEKAAQEELKKFQGTWSVASYEEDGKKKPEKEIAQMTLVFSGDSFVVKVTGNVTEQGRQILFPLQRPKALDHTISSGTDKGTTFLGIYELSGDTLKFCFAPAGQARPKEFSSKPGSGFYLINYRR